jgi:hypothetical protein
LQEVNPHEDGKDAPVNLALDDFALAPRDCCTLVNEVHATKRPSYLLMRHLYPLVNMTQSLHGSITLDLLVVVLAKIVVWSSMAVDRRLEVRNRALVVALRVLEELAHGVSWLLIDSAVVSLLAQRRKQGK